MRITYTAEGLISLSRRKTTEEYKEDLRKIGGILAPEIEYINNQIKLKHICPECKEPFNREPYKVIRDKSIYCIKCSRKHKVLAETETTEEYVERLKNIGGILASGVEYKNRSTNLWHVCPKCGEQFFRAPKHVLEGRIYCLNCSKERTVEQSSYDKNKIQKLLDEVW